MLTIFPFYLMNSSSNFVSFVPSRFLFPKTAPCPITQFPIFPLSHPPRPRLPFPTMLTIWFNAHVPESTLDRLRTAIAPNQLLISSNRTGNLAAGGPDPLLAQADIAFGQPDPDQLLSIPKLKWIQITSAGYTRYDRPDLLNGLKTRGVVFTNSSSVFDEPCAEHLLAFMLANVRAIPQSLRNQFTTRAWPIQQLRQQTRLLTGQSVLILGFGAIARRLTQLLSPLRMHIRAIRQKPRGDEPVPVFPISDLEKLLPDADHVINILPASNSTNLFMNAARFNVIKPGAVFYNIGRGTTVDQAALLSALTGGRLGGAYLDVTEPEPLPSDHPLWQAPNCYITPHIAGGHIDEFDRVVDHFLANFKAFQSGHNFATE